MKKIFTDGKITDYLINWHKNTHNSHVSTFFFCTGDISFLDPVIIIQLKLPLGRWKNVHGRIFYLKFDQFWFSLPSNSSKPTKKFSYTTNDKPISIVNSWWSAHINHLVHSPSSVPFSKQTFRENLNMTSGICLTTDSDSVLLMLTVMGTY